MKNQLNQSQRKRVYVKALEILKKRLLRVQLESNPYVPDYKRGFCDAIGTALPICGYTFNRNYSISVDADNKREMRKTFPELAECKPKSTYDSSYWWAPTANGMKKRIKVLEKIIEKM